MTETSTLASRILDAFPSGHYGLLGLLRVLDLVETDDVDTAAIECSALPRLHVNPAFVETFAATPEKLMMLIMHELHHLLLGHTRLFPRTTPAHNLVFDAVINSMLCRMFPDPQFTAMFTDFYDDARFPDCLLRPPRRWEPNRPAKAPPGLESGQFRKLRSLYSGLYSETSVGYDELFHSLASATGIATLPQLLGSHGEEPPELDSSAALFEAVRAIVEQWPQPPCPIRGRSWSEILRSEQIEVTRQQANATLLSRLIRQIARKGCGRDVAQHGGTTEALAPAERPDRRSVVLGALGGSTLLFRTELRTRYSRGRLQPVHLYLDVSGSVREYLPSMYAAVRRCRELVRDPVHLFSTHVCDIPLQRVIRGECVTTGGTDIGCVAAHIRAHLVRRAVLLTDGAVGKAAGADAAALGKCTIGVAFAAGYCIRGDLEPYADITIDLKGEQ